VIKKRSGHRRGHTVRSADTARIPNGLISVLQCITLVVVLEPVARGVYDPVTARPASRKERRYDVAQKGGEP
jgi:hypothetical protein